MTRLWWRRNAVWLALLVPALLLALGLSAFRLTTLYLPWEWSRPTLADGPVGTLEQRFHGADDQWHQRTVTVEVLSVAAVPDLDEGAAVPGATLWKVDLSFSAAPDQLLDGCTIELVDGEGTVYGFAGGRTAADPTNPLYTPPLMGPGCVPRDAPGPALDGFTGELVPSPEVRPETWEITTSMVLPEGREPEHVRIGWTRPSHLVLDIP